MLCTCPGFQVQARSQGYFGWALRMAKNRGTQLTSSKGGLNEKRKLVGTWGEPVLWAAGRAGPLCGAAGARGIVQQ